MEYVLDRKLACRLLVSFFLLAFTNTGWSQSISDVVELIRKGEIEKARETVARFDEKEHPKSSILFLKGLFSANGDSSAEYYTQLIQNYPQSKYCDDALFRLAQLQYARGLYKSALTEFKTLLKKYPQSPLRQEDSYWIGLCYQAMDQPDSSQKYLGKIQSKPRQIDLPELTESDQNKSETITPITPKVPEKPAIRYHVQTGAYSHQTNALMRKSFFEREGYHVEMRTKKIQGKTLYLIWVGMFSNKKEAEALGDQLKQWYGAAYRIVSE